MLRSENKEWCCSWKEYLVIQHPFYRFRLFGMQFTLAKRPLRFSERHGYSGVTSLPFGWKFKVCQIDYDQDLGCFCKKHVQGEVRNVRFIFPKDNQISFSQDFHYGLIGLPAEVPFECDHVEAGTRIMLKGPGHGGEPYGNGGLFVNFDDVEPYMIRSK